jgi:hypothetical protein
VHCGKPHELVRPGKTQPTCKCEAGTLVSLKDQLEPLRKQARRDFEAAGAKLRHTPTKRYRVKAPSDLSEAEVYFLGDEEP